MSELTFLSIEIWSELLSFLGFVNVNYKMTDFTEKSTKYQRSNNMLCYETTSFHQIGHLIINLHLKSPWADYTILWKARQV